MVERSKLTAIGRLLPNERMQLRSTDLEVAADTLIQHLELLREEKEDERSEYERAADILGQHIREAIKVADTDSTALAEQFRTLGQEIKATTNGNGHKETGTA